MSEFRSLIVFEMFYKFGIFFIISFYEVFILMFVFDIFLEIIIIGSGLFFFYEVYKFW